MVDLTDLTHLRSELNQLPRDLTHLPRDVVSHIAKDACPYDNPHEAAINLVTLKQTSREMPDKFKGSEIGNFEARLSRLVDLQRSLCSKALPQDLEADNPEATRMLATMQIPAIQPVFKFYSPGAQSDIVDHMMTTNDISNRTVAAGAFATNLNEVHEPSDRGRIINQALLSFADDNPLIRENGGRALARAHGHLDAVQEERLTQLFHGTPGLAQQYNELMKEQQAWYREERVQLPSPNLDRSIDTIAGQVQRLPEGISTPEQAVAAHKVAKLVAESYNCAHNELIGRSRERSSLGR